MAKTPPKTAPRPPFARIADPGAAALAELRGRFDRKELTIAALALELGVSAGTAGKRLIEWGWKPAPARRKAAAGKTVKSKSSKRAAAKPKPRKRILTAHRLRVPGLPPLLSQEAAEAMPVATKAELLRRLYALLERCLVVMERLMATGDPDDLDSSHRVSASIARIMAQINRLEGRNGPANERGSADSTAGDAPAFGSDMARVKAELVARLIAAGRSEGPAGDLGGD